MNENQKRLVLEEYEVDFKNIKFRSSLNISFNRIAFIIFIFFVFTIIFSIKIIYLGSQKDKKSKVQPYKSDFRSSILDRNGNILSQSVITTNIGINPNLIIDKKKLLINLKIIFPNKNFEDISSKIEKDKFFYLEKKISPKKYNQLFLLGDKSIIEEQKISRIYPQSELFSHIIGQIDDNNKGVSGIEKSFNHELISSKEPLKLTVDMNLQYLIRQELVNFTDIFKNIGSTAILMNINSGEILSMVSLPDFDLNIRNDLSNKIYLNRATKGVYELGSVFKTFTLASALNVGAIEIDTKFSNLKKAIRCGNHTIREYDEKIPNNLTAEQILIRSGNIGSVRIAQKVGIDKHSMFLKKIGILNKIDFDLEEVGQPIPFNWGKCKLATVSFGHGITTTPLQLAKGYAIISNGGYLISPTLVKHDNKNDFKLKKLLKNGVSKKVNKVLGKIVSSKDGTANFANVVGYNVGGKTGTAQKTIDGKYSKKKVNTFVSIFPYESPRYALLVLLDEPEANSEYVYNYRDGSNFKYKGNLRNTSGWTTVEIAGKIIEKIGPILATKY